MDTIFANTICGGDGSIMLVDFNLGYHLVKPDLTRIYLSDISAGSSRFSEK